MVTVALWADYTWCYLDEIEDYPYLSDDFMLVEVPDGQEVEDWIWNEQPQG